MAASLLDAPSVAASDDRDVWLQTRLAQLGSTFTLLPHQPVAVRAVAGVDRAWSGEPTASPRTHGLILADDMGAGKTVSVLSGLLLRDTITQGPHLVIGPNWAVIDQWREHAERSAAW